MKFTTCPKCGEENIGSSGFCVKCGASLSSATSTESRLSEIKPTPSSYGQQNSYASHSSSRNFSRYAALRGIAGLCTVISWIVVVIAGIVALVILFTAIPDDFARGLGLLIADALVGGLIFVIFRILAEGISVLLDIEENTRQTSGNTRRANILLEKLMDQQSRLHD